jgi:hypothetical protein
MEVSAKEERLMECAHDGDLAGVTALCEEGVDPDFRHPDVMLCTALHLAVMEERHQVCSFLVEKACANPYAINAVFSFWKAFG